MWRKIDCFKTDISLIALNNPYKTYITLSFLFTFIKNSSNEVRNITIVFVTWYVEFEYK